MLFIIPKHSMLIVFVVFVFISPPIVLRKQVLFMILCVCVHAHVNVKGVFWQISESESANCPRILTLVDPVFLAQPWYWFGST